MAINKSKGNMYEGWQTWNPLGGKCPHNCKYCSTNSFYYPELIKKYSGEPRLCEKTLLKNLGNGKQIFVVAQNDLFADAIPEQFINKVLEHCKKFDNTYLFQTKNPQRFIGLHFPVKSIICTTLESDSFYPDFMGDTSHPIDRSMAMNYFRDIPITKQVTIEPIMEFHLEHFVTMIKRCHPDVVAIGADSKNKHLPEPSKEKILALISELSKFTNIVRKTNLERLLK